MKKAFLFLILFFGLLPVNQVWSQIGSYQTVYSEMTSTNTATGFEREITIGFYPDMAVSYHETVLSGVNKGIITVNCSASTGYYNVLPDKIYIRDMKQHEFNPYVYFCGTMHIPSGISVDSVGIIGYFKVNIDGTVPVLNYFTVSEVNVVNKLVAYNSNGKTKIAAFGKNQSNISLYYYLFVDDATLPNYTYRSFYPWVEPHNPVDIVCTDDYVCYVCEYGTSNLLYLRKFLKSNFSDPINGILYKYYLWEPVTHTSKSTFLGCKAMSDNENLLGNIYLSQSATNEWTAHFKVIDLSTMSPLIAQKQAIFAEKNEIAGLTYLADSKKVAVLEIYDPTLVLNNSVVLILDHLMTVNYSTELLYRSGHWFYSIDRLYNSNLTVNHFLVGNTSMPINRWWAQIPVFSTNNNCIKKLTTEIQIEQLPLVINYTSPMTFNNNSSTWESELLTKETINNNYRCPYPIK